MTETRVCPVCGQSYSRTRYVYGGVDKGLARWTATCSKKCAGATVRARFADRFWASVDQSAGPEGCWPWIKAVNRLGYGIVGREGRVERTHRVAWALRYNDGVLPERKVLHSCDNRRCCNPAHLRIGTQAENMADMRQRGRRKGINVGGENGRSVLSAADVQTIRSRLSTGESQQSIADDYNISQTTVSGIKVGRLWSMLLDDEA